MAGLAGEDDGVGVRSGSLGDGDAGLGDDDTLSDVRYRHRQARRISVAVLIGGAHGHLVDVIVVAVLRILIVLSGQGQLTAVGIDPEGTGINTLHRPSDLSVRVTFDRGYCRCPLSVFLYRGILEAREHVN